GVSSVVPPSHMPLIESVTVPSTADPDQYRAEPGPVRRPRRASAGLTVPGPLPLAARGSRLRRPPAALGRDPGRHRRRGAARGPRPPHAAARRAAPHPAAADAPVSLEGAGAGGL